MKAVAYEAVFNQIQSQLQKGIIPWRKPWKGNFPINAKTGRRYSGINFFMLSCQEFTDNRWLTFKQLQEMGGNVRKGEKSTQVVFWQILNKELEDGQKKSIPLLKYYNVFNVEQTEGVEWSKVEIEPNQSAEEVIEGYSDKPVIKHFGNTAAYIPSKDEIIMPPMNVFNDTNEYYCTLFHEMIHSTGHKDRLARKGVTENTYFGDTNYSEEELVAEFGASFLCHSAGIDNTLENSAAYIQSWLKVFKSDPSIIVHAASKAQKAADYVLGIKKSED